MAVNVPHVPDSLSASLPVSAPRGCSEGRVWANVWSVFCHPTAWADHPCTGHRFRPDCSVVVCAWCVARFGQDPFAPGFTTSPRLAHSRLGRAALVRLSCVAVAIQRWVGTGGARQAGLSDRPPFRGGGIRPVAPYGGGRFPRETTLMALCPPRYRGTDGYDGPRSWLSVVFHRWAGGLPPPWRWPGGDGPPRRTCGTGPSAGPRPAGGSARPPRRGPWGGTPAAPLPARLRRFVLPGGASIIHGLCTPVM